MRSGLLFFLLSINILLCPALAERGSKIADLIAGARRQIGKTILYDGSYQRISYPGGDIPLEKGVCTDVIVRAYRELDIDLQKEVHQDMSAHFSAYPSKRIWGLSKPDSNIDHRRVPNLKKFFERNGKKIPLSPKAQKAKPGDLLTWMLPAGLPHIGIVSDRRTPDGKRHLVIHNIGRGAQEEDVIEKYKLTGHYRYTPWKRSRKATQGKSAAHLAD